MFETLEQFRKRTWFIERSLPEQGGFKTAAGLAHKAGQAGELRPFFGNTVIFGLRGEDIAWLALVQDALYKACGDWLSERLLPETFHITLHDLISGPSWQAIEQRVCQTGKRAQETVCRIRSSFPWGIHVRARCLMNMANTSVVLAFEPEDEANCQAMMAMHDAFERIVPLPYPLTPHVTLGYFRPGEIDERGVARLRAAFERANVSGRVMHLEADALRCCVFTDMNHYRTPARTADDLDRFLRAQAGGYEAALTEIRSGKKRGHWMWYVFPQLKGLGSSVYAEYYGLSGMEEARAYLAHPVLGPRLVQIADALTQLEVCSPTQVMGWPDDMKLRSCMTLFEAAGGGNVFARVLDKFYGGQRDNRTIDMLRGGKQR